MKNCQYFECNICVEVSENTASPKLLHQLPSATSSIYSEQSDGLSSASGMTSPVPSEFSENNEDTLSESFEGKVHSDGRLDEGNVSVTNSGPG